MRGKRWGTLSVLHNLMHSCVHSYVPHTFLVQNSTFYDVRTAAGADQTVGTWFVKRFRGERGTGVSLHRECSMRRARSRTHELSYRGVARLIADDRKADFHGFRTRGEGGFAMHSGLL